MVGNKVWQIGDPVQGDMLERMLNECEQDGLTIFQILETGDKNFYRIVAYR